MSTGATTFATLFRVKHGYAFPGEHFGTEGDFVVLTPGNFHEAGGFREVPEKEKRFSGDVPPAFILGQGDLIVAMTEQGEGLLGSSALVPGSGKYLHNQRLGKIVDLDTERLDQRYLYRLFNAQEVRHQIRATASGTKVRHTAPERIGKVRVQLPSLRAQQRIVEVADAYDFLIANNRRRIAMLEEAARLLYREWFVRLRFPEHGGVRVVDGVPEGWERATVGDALRLQRGFDLPIQDRLDGLVPIYGSTGINGYHSLAKAVAPGVVTGRSGSIGDVALVQVDFWPLNTALWVTDFLRVSPYYALHLLRELDLKQYYGGVSVPSLDRKTVHRIPVSLPPRTLVDAFDEAVGPMYSQADTLARMSEKLREARDLLLPRLMSGEIDL